MATGQWLRLALAAALLAAVPSLADWLAP